MISWFALCQISTNTTCYCSSLRICRNIIESVASTVHRRIVVDAAGLVQCAQANGRRSDVTPICDVHNTTGKGEAGSQEEPQEAWQQGAFVYALGIVISDGSHWQRSVLRSGCRYFTSLHHHGRSRGGADILLVLYPNPSVILHFQFAMTL